jgi:hypothetical protein
MSILLITEIEGAHNCAAAIARQLEMAVEVAAGRRAALSLLRRHEYAVIVVDEAMAEGDPDAAEALWRQARLAIPLQVNFALSGAARLVRDIRSALNRREREQVAAMHAAAAAVETRVKSTVAGLLLNSELALADGSMRPETASRLRLVVELAGSLRQQLAGGAA